ncbi:MAG: arylsulfatase [Catalinimonas sp.]
MNKPPRMNRNAARLSTVFLSVLLLSGCGRQQTTREAPAEAAQRHPNVIYIMADDLGYADLGSYGQRRFRTPHIDRLAAEGMRFTDHYAGTAVCAPSRCVLITGQHMGRATVRGNMQWEPHGQLPLPDSVVTVAEVAKEAGYVTGMIGKWGLGISGTEGDPNVQGWDYFYGYTDQVLAHNYWPEYLVRNGERVILDNEVQYLDSTAWHEGLGSYSTGKTQYSNDLFTDEAIAFIEREQARPFLLYLPYTIPHDNGEAPVGARLEVPDLGSYADEGWASDSAGYAAMIERLDGYVGRIVRTVDSLGLGENTLIVFTSDNGPMSEAQGITAFFDSNGPLRGGKRDLYEGGIRVPFVARWTGRVAAGTTSDHVSYFGDFLATVCDVAGVEPPAGTDGLSYLPELLGESQPPHDFLYFSFYEGNKSQAVRRGRWKGVRNDVFTDPSAPWELYDLDADLAETTDLAAQHPDEVRALDSLARLAHHPDPFWPLLASEQ